GAIEQIEGWPCSSFVDGYPAPEHGERLLRRSHLTQSRRRDRKIAFRASAALRRRLAQGGFDEALLFKPFERVVHAREDDLFTGALRDRVRNRHAVGLLPLTQERQHHEQFEMPQRFP